MTRALVDAGTTGVAYETVELPDGSLPLLAPMFDATADFDPGPSMFNLTSAGGNDFFVAKLTQTGLLAATSADTSVDSSSLPAISGSKFDNEPSPPPAGRRRRGPRRI